MSFFQPKYETFLEELTLINLTDESEFDHKVIKTTLY